MKKGFTLVEVLAVIVILGLLVVIIVPVVNNLLGDSEDALYDKQIDSIEKATQKYMVEHSEFMPDEGGSTSFYLYELVNNGVIENNKIINPKTKEELDGCVVVSYNNEFNQFEYNYSDDDNECSLSSFDYSGTEQVYVANSTGYYRVETWGAQGGNLQSKILSDFPSYSSLRGGYGGYSSGIVNLEKNTILYINIGGQGDFVTYSSSNIKGGYNGGGEGGHGAITYWVNNRGKVAPLASSGGGGATSVAFVSGLLSHIGYQQSITNNKLLLVSGGGGGISMISTGNGGSGGGIQGSAGVSFSNISVNGGNQTTGFAFGMGQNGHISIQGTDNDAEGSGGGGGGLYGGFSYQGTEAMSDAHGAGGSGYIGNSLLSDKYMYCYDCQESSDASTKTISTTGSSNLRDTVNCPEGYSNNPVSKCAKAGNGFVRITYLGESIS